MNLSDVDPQSSWRQIKTCVTVSAVAAVLVLFTGCAATGDDERAFQSRVIRSGDADRVLLAAAEVVRREFGRVAVDRGARRCVSDPVEFRVTSGSGSTRDLYGGASTLRRIAYFQCARRGESVVAQLRVDVERENSDRMAGVPQEPGRFGDSPAQTPVERDAATTTRQNQAWLLVKRDFQLERQLLEDLQAEFDPAAREATPTTSAPAARNP